LAFGLSSGAVQHPARASRAASRLAARQIGGTARGPALDRIPNIWSSRGVLTGPASCTSRPVRVRRVLERDMISAAVRIINWRCGRAAIGRRPPAASAPPNGRPRKLHHHRLPKEPVARPRRCSLCVASVTQPSSGFAVLAASDLRSTLPIGLMAPLTAQTTLCMVPCLLESRSASGSPSRPPVLPAF